MQKHFGKCKPSLFIHFFPMLFSQFLHSGFHFIFVSTLTFQVTHKVVFTSLTKSVLYPPWPLSLQKRGLVLCPRSTLLLCPLWAHLIILVAVHPLNRHYTVKLSQCSFPLNNRDSLATMWQPIMTITTARAHQRIMGDYYLWSAPKQDG